MKKICLLIALCFAAAGSYATTYCTPTFGSPCSSYPMKGSIANLTGSSGVINDTTPCITSSYENMTSMSVTLTAGASYTATLAVSPTYYTNFSAQIWIDFNNDGTFSSSESVGGGSYFSSSSPAITIVTPGSAPSGTWRMRMVSNYQCCGASAYPSMNPCPTTAISLWRCPRLYRKYCVCRACNNSNACFH
jgi:hypothetical protein